MIYFVTEQWLENNTPITSNVDATDVSIWLTVNAENWVRKIIGTYFFNDLLKKYNNQTLSADEITLVDMMKPAIAWRAASDAVYGLSYQLKNKGLTQQSGDYSEPSELNEVQFGMEHYAQKAANYEQVIYDYLSDYDNAELYPNFESKLNKDSRD